MLSGLLPILRLSQNSNKLTKGFFGVAKGHLRNFESNNTAIRAQAEPPKILANFNVTFTQSKLGTVRDPRLTTS
jgi:hypothetical protein